MNKYTKTISILVLLLVVLLEANSQTVDAPVNKAIAEDNASPYLQYINNPVLDLSLSNAQALLEKYKDDEFSNSAYSIEKALVLFRIARLVFEETEVLQAFEYWQKLYELPAYKNPMHFAYLGTLEAMHGGAIQTPKPILKTRLAKQGLEKIADAIKDLSSSNDAMTLSYAYFLEGVTKSSLPDFFKEFEEAPQSLNSSIKQLSKVRKHQIYADELLYFLVSYNYAILGDFYLKKGKARLARKFYTTAKKYLSKIESSGELFATVEEQLRLLK